jgi:phosphoribosylglycinamide formyltransferase-1
MPLKLAVLLSGSGTTLQNLIDRIEAGELSATVGCVISSQPSAYGLERAKQHGIPHTAITRKQFPDGKAFNCALWQEIAGHNVDLVALAGFMCRLEIPKDFENRIMNVHPALLPAFCGKGMYGHHVYEAVLASGAKITGATVHFVDNEYDHGPIILQAAVPVLDDDTPDTLAARVQAKERELYPRAIQLFAENRLHIEKSRVRIT